MYVVETDRLRLRRFTVDDAEFILDLVNQPSFLRHIGDKGVRTTEDARGYILVGPVASYENNGFGLYLVEVKSSGAEIGMCGLVNREALEDVDIGFAFLPLSASSSSSTTGRNCRTGWRPTSWAVQGKMV